MREFTIDEWSDLAHALTVWLRQHPGASREDIDAQAEIEEDAIRRWQECASRRTVQLGSMSATNLKCVLARIDHKRRHRVSRHFLDVKMTAEWDGEFEE